MSLLAVLFIGCSPEVQPEPAASKLKEAKRDPRRSVTQLRAELAALAQPLDRPTDFLDLEASAELYLQLAKREISREARAEAAYEGLKLARRMKAMRPTAAHGHYYYTLLLEQRLRLNKKKRLRLNKIRDLRLDEKKRLQLNKKKRLRLKKKKRLRLNKKRDLRLDEKRDLRLDEKRDLQDSARTASVTSRSTEPLDQSDLRKLFAGFRETIRLNEHYQHGGGYRQLARLYAYAPKGTRNFAEAEFNFLEAQRVASHWPENYLQYARVLVTYENYEQALEQLDFVEALMQSSETQRYSAEQAYLISFDLENLRFVVNTALRSGAAKDVAK